MLGLSTDGNLENADVFFAGVSNGQPYSSQNTMRVLWGYGKTDNTRIPKSKTTYWCKSFETPQLDEQVHAIVFSPYIQEGNEAFVHHIIVYGCYGNTSKGNNNEHDGKCYSKNMPIDWNNCIEVVFGWAVGGSKFALPEHAGIPVGGKDDPAYYLLEMHYDNPHRKEGIIDSSGIDITLTKSKRQYDAGTLSIGYAVRGYSQLIPPYAEEFKYYGNCEACGSMITPEGNNQWNEDGVKMFAVLLHAHLAGRKIRVRHIRNGKLLPDVMYDENYDFNYQETRYMKKETILLKGDILQTECVYDTTQRTKFTKGGLGTEEEMCLAYIQIYPRTKLKSCVTDVDMDPLHYKNNEDAIKKMELIVNGLEPKTNFTQICSDRSSRVKYKNRPFPVIKSDDLSTIQPTTTEENSAAKFCVTTGIIFIFISYWLI
ncbi:DBH-like monooxygenase protein 1 [Octopus vulgaris]|uniref:DBH-like monooxygenase protein 1 n=1 Tax=Octopus vulgaris TaxID=6645 RepID=A0AA36B4P7_OCTVU|nr:DBH-like monooxygenase protein 1 [Octopus vulgaris]